jgi:acyl-CoA thioester hydrolase
MLLNQEQLELAGVGEEWIMGLLDTVRFADLDPYNHVNNKIYHTWFENLRVSYLANSGFDFSDNKGAMPVVRKADIEYIAPMFMDEDYITVIRCSRLGRTSFDLDYAVFVDGVIRTRGQTMIVMADLAAGTSLPVSDDVRELFITRDKAAT